MGPIKGYYRLHCWDCGAYALVDIFKWGGGYICRECPEHSIMGLLNTVIFPGAEPIYHIDQHTAEITIYD